MGSTSVAVCGVNSAGWRYNNAGIAAWRIHMGIIKGALLYLSPTARGR